MEEYFSGAKLYGDDFTPQQIAEWVADEKEAYADLGAGHREPAYGYHALNIRHGLRHLSNRRFERALGFGSAFAEEFAPIAERIGHLTVVEPSDAFARTSVHDIPTRYVKPSPTGQLDFSSDSFDFVSCIDVLHHLPNVSAVIAELARVTKPGGMILLREPIISLGDWRVPRRGLTKRERGIPRAILRQIVASNGLIIAHESLCFFPLTYRIFNGLNAKCLGTIYNRAFPTWVDAMLCGLFSWNTHYHPRTLLQKFCPHAVFMVLTKHHASL